MIRCVKGYKLGIVKKEKYYIACLRYVKEFNMYVPYHILSEESWDTYNEAELALNKSFTYITGTHFYKCMKCEVCNEN